MFREMLRKKQALTLDECVRVLREEKRGVLSVIGDDGYPYALPIDHYWADDGHIYFHCGRTGHKLDAVRKHDKVSYCVCDEGFRKEGEWALNIRSVVIFGRMHPVDEEDDAMRRKIAIGLCRKFTDDEAFLQNELKNALPRASFLELIPEHMTGKLVNES